MLNLCKRGGEENYLQLITTHHEQLKEERKMGDIRFAVNI